jgi:acyl-CoA thioester hydrolase
MRLALPTRYVDYDSMGHVNNAVYLTYFEMARSAAWLGILGMPHEPSFIIAEAAVRYKSPARMEDSLEIEMRTSEIRNRAWVWEYEIRCSSDDRLIAEGSTVQVMFDYAARKAVPIPQDLRERLAAV